MSGTISRALGGGTSLKWPLPSAPVTATTRCGCAMSFITRSLFFLAPVASKHDEAAFGNRRGLLRVNALSKGDSDGWLAGTGSAPIVTDTTSFGDELPAEHILAGIGLRLLSVAMFASLSALVKLAEYRGVALAETMFFRQTC